MTPDDEGNEGPKEPGEGKAMYMGVVLKEGRGSVFVSSSPSGKRGGGGIGDDGGMGDNGSTVNNEKLDRSVSIIEGRIKYLGSSGACGGCGINGVLFDCSVIQRGTGLWGKSKEG